MKRLFQKPTLHMALSAGTRVGQCQILSALGAGWIGEVYQSRDAWVDGRWIAVMHEA